MASRCDHIYVIQSSRSLGNGYKDVTYRCGRCGDTFTSNERE
jgi:hypothetical protein